MVSGHVNTKYYDANSVSTVKRERRDYKNCLDQYYNFSDVYTLNTSIIIFLLGYDSGAGGVQ